MKVIRFKILSKFLLVAAMISLFSCSKDDDSYVPLIADSDEELSGGDNTSFNFSAEAFGFAAPNLEFDDRVTFGLGNSLFNQSWVTAPASTTARDGLGPFFNSRSCSGCHFKDGRGRPPLMTGELSHGLLLRLNINGTDENGFPLGDPTYGNQFQDNSILSVEKEGVFAVTYQSITETYDDGTQIQLQKPTYSFPELTYGAMAGNTKISPRVATQMIGLGLLDALDESTLVALQDISDANGDGISGKANYVYDIENNSVKIGRFGWKANQPTIKQQVAAAFSGDLGITSTLFSDENCPSPVNCDDFPNGGTPEIPDENLDAVAFYSSTLAVPARRDVDDQDVLEGKQLFEAMQCASCHIPKLQTGFSPIADLSNQTIRPYTDLLLHDMGKALADNAPEFLANGQEWRTPPLWGIGLIETVNNHTNLLHDGRARTIEEAILWHGGEAETAKQNFKALSSTQRTQVLLFLNSL